jgi:AcrR family transcriptional regulator
MDMAARMSEYERMADPSPPAARKALLASFAELAMSRRYGEIGVDAIVRTANVARSTFYYHFASKDELLLENLDPLIGALAGAPFTETPGGELERWIEHIAQHRAQAARLLAGRTGAKLQYTLAAAIQTRLVADRPVDDAVRLAMDAEQVAGGIMALLRAWASNRISTSNQMIAQALWDFSRAAIGGSGTAG